MVGWLLHHGADADGASESGDTALSHAVEYAPLSIINMLLDSVEDASHGYLLHRAIHRPQSDRLDVFKLLLEHGAPVNQVMYQDQVDEYMMMAFANLGAPLHMAAEYGYQDVVALLVQSGADSLIEDSKGLNVIDRAVISGQADVAAYLRNTRTMASQPRNVFTKRRQAGLDLIY